MFHFKTFTRDILQTWYRVLFSRSIIFNRSATAPPISSSIVVLRPSYYNYSLRSSFHYYYLRFYSPCGYLLSISIVMSPVGIKSDNLMSYLSICARFVVFPCDSTQFLGRPALCYRSVVQSVCNVRTLWPSRWLDLDEPCHAVRLRPWPHCVGW